MATKLKAKKPLKLAVKPTVKKVAPKVVAKKPKPVQKEARVIEKVAANRVADACKDFLITLPLSLHAAIKKEADKRAKISGLRPNMSEVMRDAVEKLFGIKRALKAVVKSATTPKKELKKHGPVQTTVKAKPSVKPSKSGSAPVVPTVRPKFSFKPPVRS